MQISKLLWIAFLAGATALQLYAQPASPELQGRALELLRQTLSQGGAPPAGNSTSMQPLNATPTALPSSPASNDQQQQAIMLLRQTLAQPDTSPRPVATPRATPAVRPAGKATAAPFNRSVARPMPTAPTPAMPDQPAGPKTKQQRLMDLLEQYRADKLTPAEYQTERAKILSGP
jgi:hypothetical protein